MKKNFIKPIKKTLILLKYFWVLCIGLQFAFPAAAIAGSDSASEFFAVLNGENAVPSQDTPATGKAVFRFDEAKKLFNYKLTVNKIEHVVSANLHLGTPGKGGPMVATLAGPFPPGKGQREGVLAEGTLSVFNLVGPMLAEQTGEDDERLLAELLGKMRKGKTYINIVTDPGWDPNQNKPGRFPKNEIRGQIEPVDK
ncbi:MAG TPA: CHRD domain-containing protein [Nitrospiria bacterium]|jgi:hypothetical protein